jgi:hypothetical protein
MDDADRFRLLGQYRTPRVRVGAFVRCLIRGEVEVVGFTDGPIPWPKCKTARRHAVILYASLARAVRRESAQAVAHWWGVISQTQDAQRCALLGVATVSYSGGGGASPAGAVVPGSPRLRARRRTMSHRDGDRVPPRTRRLPDAGSRSTASGANCPTRTAGGRCKR